MVKPAVPTVSFTMQLINGHFEPPPHTLMNKVQRCITGGELIIFLSPPRAIFNFFRNFRILVDDTPDSAYKVKMSFDPHFNVRFLEWSKVLP